MANYDKPAFAWNNISKTINLDVELNDFDIAVGANDITSDLFVAAFNGGTGGSGSPSGQDINGYGYSHSG